MQRLEQFMCVNYIPNKRQSALCSGRHHAVEVLISTQCSFVMLIVITCL
jgi:hypothetical protein